MEQNKIKQAEVFDQETKDMERLRQPADKRIKLLELAFGNCVDSGRKEIDMSIV